jgi:2-keto-4-pentenoate hydratase/2-oxohepta-3-ene-1,7-dioic acid hydratase in catechol pathway
MKLKVLEGSEGFVVVTCHGADLSVASLDDPSILLGDRPAAPLETGARLDPSRYREVPPVRPGKIVAIGLNYQDHVDETGSEAPDSPLIFAKFPSTVVGDGDEIVFDPGLARRVDWEVELAVVVARSARHVPMAEALDFVFGYSVANDVSARDLQFADGQWIRGKSLDTFCPIGPVVVTADELPDPQRLNLGTRVNGEPVQQSNTSKMIFSAAEIISFCSRSFTLDPGDVILTGTPWGCGEFMDPVRSLEDGDLVETEVEGIGMLSNTVRTEDRTGS